MFIDKYKDNPREFARWVRKEVAIINNRTRDSHIGGGYSSTDILAVLYSQILNISRDNLDDPNRDVFILSKGHIATTMYCTLACAGIIPYEFLEEHIKDGSKMQGHVRRDFVPGVEMSSGSLGHGEGVGCGFAYAKKQLGYKGNVYVLMGDGECNEGSVWESIMFAVRFKLDNLIFVLDRNRLQSYGSDLQVLNMGDMASKFHSFGCDTRVVNGHDYDALYRIFSELSTAMNWKPHVVVTNTVKGKGVSYMENQLEWHFRSPDGELLDTALNELNNKDIRP